MMWSLDVDGDTALHEQIAASVRRGLATGELSAGERLPPATELAGVLAVHPNTVLQAYRRLRAEGLLEFRRGRGARIRADAAVDAQVVAAVRALLALGRDRGYRPRQLSRLLEDLA